MTIPKSFFTFLFILGFTFSASASPAAREQKSTPDGRGYYKDLFMDSGVLLTSRYDLASARALGLDMETFVSTNHKESRNTAADTILQQMIINGNPLDENGILLFPDGAPRFRVIYMNGGKAVNHANVLDVEGRQRIQDFVKAGGSYVGSCAGAFMATRYTRGDSLKVGKVYMGLWPGSVRGTGISNRRHGVVFPRRSPLLRYYDFGGDRKADSIIHNGGCYGDEEQAWPRQGEVLARYETRDIPTKRPVDGSPVIWSYKESASTGRTISCGSHPEKDPYGEALQLMNAMLLYAMDGNAPPTVKAHLTLDTPYALTACTHDADPAHTRIGDHQYHHFTIDVPRGLDSLVVTLSSPVGWEACDLYLMANRGSLAWKEDAHYLDISEGTDKVLVIPAPKAGKWYLSVYGGTTVSTTETAKGTLYTDHLEVLNGIPYTLTVLRERPAPAEP